MPATRRHAAGRPQQAGEDAQEGGLAGAVGADQPEQLARFDRQRHVVQRLDGAVALGDVLGRDGGGHGRFTTESRVTLGFTSDFALRNLAARAVTALRQSWSSGSTVSAGMPGLSALVARLRARP